MSVWTYVGQIVNFLVFVVILRFLLYKPVRRVMQKRKEEMEAELRAAEEKLREAEKIRSEAEKSAKELEEKRDSVLKEAREQAEAHRKELLEQAEEQARGRLARFRRIMEQERSELFDKITDELRDAIVQVSGSVLRDSGSTLADYSLERVEAMLKDVSDEEIEGARKALDGLGHRVTVRSAGELTAKQVARLRKMLRETLRVEEIELQVEEDPSLLAGVEVMLGHLRLEAHWRGVMDESMQEQRKALQKEESRARQEVRSRAAEEAKPEAREAELKTEPEAKPEAKGPERKGTKRLKREAAGSKPKREPEVEGEVKLEEEGTKEEGSTK